MKYKLISYLSIWVVLTVIFACNTGKKMVEKTNVKNYTPTEKALLWKIEKKEMANPSFLYGTIHIIPKDDFFYPDGTLNAIEKSKSMVFEIDMNLMSDMSAQMGLMQKSIMKDGSTLKDLITAEDYELVKNHFKKIGLPLALFERMKPAFLSVFASEDMSPNALQSGQMKSYEMEFLEISKTKNMTVGGLETIDYQLGVFDSIPYADQAKMLVESIKSAEKGNDELTKMVQVYKSQDLEGMNAMFSDESLGDMDILLNNRNKNWIPVMKAYMEKSATFFAVGAGHLVGEKGVISLLRQEGYSVTPLSNEK